MFKRLFYKLIGKNRIKSHETLVFLNKICELLEIETPKISSVACLYIDDNGRTMAVQNFDINDVPTKDASFIAAFYADERNEIFIAGKIPDYDMENHELCLRDRNYAETFCILAHELRHVWQKKYHADVYYKHDARNLEIIDDIAEIDADAFAISYVFSDRTPFTHEDMPEWIEELCLQAALDGGKRWNRVRELSEEYGFNNKDKIEAVKQGVDYGKINKIVSAWKAISK